MEGSADLGYVLQEQVRRLEVMCEAERETVPEEVQRQLADAGLALTKALEECRAVLRQNRQVRRLRPQRNCPPEYGHCSPASRMTGTHVSCCCITGMEVLLPLRT